LRHEGSRILRRASDHLLDAFVKAIEGAYGTQPVSISQLRTIAETLKQSSAIEEHYSRATEELVRVITRAVVEERRSNALGRLMLHPLSDSFAQGLLYRDIVPNLFSFLHLVLGDQVDEYNKQALDVVHQLKQERGDDFTWDHFYESEYGKRVRFRVLTSIARTFERFDIRKDWFIKLMQYAPTTVSVGSSAFVVQPHSNAADDVRVFNEHHFAVLFRAWFQPVRNLTEAEERLYMEETHQTPARAFSNFFVNLARLPA
jgi:hypothetical protein